jgi:zinc transport system substrate-binding protein
MPIRSKGLPLIKPRSIQLIAIACLFLHISLLPAAPNVVVSIKPVHSLVAGIMQGVDEPSLLVRGNQSPHNFSLRPSDMRMLQQADLVVWVGPDVETSLANLFENNRLSGVVAVLTEIDSINLLQPRNDMEWEARQQKQLMESDHGHIHHRSIDSHIWLSPEIARQIVAHITDQLCEMDGRNAENYRQNSQRLRERLNQLDNELNSRLAPIKDRPYIVFHDAYHYFENHYGLNAVGSVSISPERQPGARHIHHLKDKIKRLQAYCVFSEPQFRPKLVETLVEGTKAKTGQLDPLGTDFEAGPEAYFHLMHKLADNLVECLD